MAGSDNRVAPRYHSIAPSIPIYPKSPYVRDLIDQAPPITSPASVLSRSLSQLFSHLESANHEHSIHGRKRNTTRV